MQGDEEQAEIPGDDELLDMPGRELQTLAMKHDITCRACADMRTRLLQIRDHGFMFCLECEDGVKRPLYQANHRCELLAHEPARAPVTAVCMYVCMNHIAVSTFGHLLIGGTGRCMGSPCSRLPALAGGRSSRGCPCRWWSELFSCCW
jgi:hypothetical protein